MERFFLVVVLCFTWTPLAFSDHHKWDYVKGGNFGPSKWGGICQTGQKQTPIDINSTTATYNKDLKALTLTNYDSTPSVTFSGSNNGHTLTISFPEDVYNVSEGGLTGVYTTVQFHLHWGSANTKGSEHYLDGKQYAAELHFVSYNTKYENISVAVEEPDGLAVLGVFLKVEGDNNTNYNFLEEARNVIDKNTTKDGITAFKFKGMLPNDMTKFFRYSGSLTTPNCQESVTWTVFKDPVMISQYQMNLLRMLKDSNDNQMVDNFRPLKELNNRTVYSSFEVTSSKPSSTKPPVVATTADASAVNMTAGLFLLMLFAAFFMH